MTILYGDRPLFAASKLSIDKADMVDYEIYRSHAARCVAKGIKSLPPTQEKYLKAYYKEGLTTIQIAERYGTTKSTVSRTLKRARLNLAEVLRYSCPWLLDADIEAGRIRNYNRSEK